MNNDKNEKIIEVLFFAYLITQIFAYFISFYDSFVDSYSIIQKVIDLLYYYRNIMYYLSIIICLLFGYLTLPDIILVGILLISYLFLNISYKGNLPYFNQILPVLKYSTMAFIILQSNVLRLENLVKWSIFVARIFCCVLISVTIINSDEIMSSWKYMDLANAFSIIIALLIYSGIIHKKKYDLILAISSLIMVLVMGSRGAFLTLVILILFMLWLKENKTKLLLALGGLSVSLASLLPILLQKMIDILDKMGISSRSLDKLTSGSFLKSNDRAKIYDYLLEVLNDHSVFGIGICGDRYYLPKKFSGVDATYAHNLFLEIFLDFGVYVGLFISIFLIKILFEYYWKEKDINKKAFYSVFVIVGFVQLMTSRSWLTEANIFILFSMLLTYDYETLSKREEVKKYYESDG